MTTPRPLDPAEPLGEGRTIIEASAGTGKTFTIAATVARLVTAEGVDLDRILVVTFTRAATAELKGRVRDRLVMTLQALEGSPPDEPDEHLDVQLALPPDDRETAARRLRRALTDFDGAQIFTIHGFAQRLLGRLGFRVRLPETLEPGEVDDLMLTQVASDLVVARYAHNPDGEEVITLSDAARAGREILGHPDARVVPEAADVEAPFRALVEMANEVAAEAQRRMRAAGAMTFDDGLIEVRDALTDPEVGQAAGALLRRYYDVGLVDESQDTDPIQWQIVRRIFDDSRLVVIGDPKQSIYSFRGADIEAYVSAVRGADAHRTLNTNWRSDGPLVEALDVLFAGATFGDDLIEYRKVEPADIHRSARIAGTGAPLCIRSLSSDLPIDRRKDGCFAVGACREMVAADVAAKIVGLLNRGVVITRDDGSKMPLGPSDIAVLCRTRSTVEMVRRELADRNVPSVAARTGGVLASPAAKEWRRFLLGIERPDRLDLVRLAATTSLVGRPLDEIAALDDEGALELQRQMRGWHDTLVDGGIPALVASLGRETRLAVRLLATPDGERLMTDLIHIAEELHAVFRRGRAGPLAAWLETAMEEAANREQRNAEEPESRQRRLETDADAVTVQTIHGAKGLQYPVVLVPYAWDVAGRKPAYPVFHDPEPTRGDEPRQRLINVAGNESPGFDDHCDLAMAEDEAEESRLLYVALTRAQHHLMVWWVENHARIDEAKLTDLLHRDGHTPETLASSSNGRIEVSTVTEVPPSESYRPPSRQPAMLEHARWARETDQTWRRVSFTSLSADQPLAAVEEKTEHPLRSDEAAAPESEDTPASTALLPMADLPAGARFGTLVHDLLERLSFDAADLEAELAALTEVELRTVGWDFAPETLAAGVAAAVTTPLGPDPDAVALADLDSARLARELVFELPVRTRADAMTLGDIGRVMDRYLDPDDPYRDFVTEAMARPFQPFRGYLSGAVDLVAVLPGERYVVMDYKSNYLPVLGAVPGPGDYGPAALASEMNSHRYVLQATLYQVALHRYLQWRLPGYDPATHLGGSMYLFIRGMIGPDTPIVAGERCGVARWQPPAEMIVALSRLLAGDDDD
ncbi:MAG: UvrD-helicase domain-containing protein [Actinomycetota bacterium]